MNGIGVLPQLGQKTPTINSTTGILTSPKADNVSIFKKTKSSVQPFMKPQTQKGGIQ